MDVCHTSRLSRSYAAPAKSRFIPATAVSTPAALEKDHIHGVRKYPTKREKSPQRRAKSADKSVTVRKMPAELRISSAAATAACRELQTACEEGDVEKAEEILSSGSVDPNDGALLKGKSPLYWAVVRGKLPLVKALVERFGSSPSFVTDHSGTTLFHAACARGHLDVARYLSSSRGVETATSRKDGSTPMMAACFYGHLPVVKFLVEDLHCEVQLPVSCSAEGSLLYVACSSGKADVVRYLVSKCGLDPSAPRKYGETPMHVACSRGNLEVVRYLSEEQGCSLEVADDTGDTPLHMSAQNNHHTVVRFILERGSKVDVANHRGFTPLMLACCYGKREAAKVLLEVGKADPNRHNGENESPLQCTRDKTIITELVRHGANTTKFISSLLENHRKSSSDEALVRMFIVGHPMAGKSTLVEALQEVKRGVHSRLLKRRKITGVPPSTAGIVPVEFENPELGRVLLFDFAGQNEYYASHAALLEASKTSAPLFLLVVNLLEADEEIKFQINFWLSFINNHHVPGAGEAHIAVIGSHKDKLRKEFPLVFRKKLVAVESTVKSSVREYPLLHMLGFFPVDCRKPHKQAKLRHTLQESCRELRSNSEVDGCCHILSVFLAEKFAGEITCTVGKVVGEIKHSDFALPCTAERLCELVDALSERQNILLLRNSAQVDQSWIVLEVDTLFSKINGCIFAPANFKERRFSSDSGTGVVSWSHLQSAVLELKLDPELVAAFLRKLEFCEEVYDPEILSLIRQGTPTCDVVPSRAATTPGRFCSTVKEREQRGTLSKPQIQVEDEGLTFAMSSGVHRNQAGPLSPPNVFPTLTGGVSVHRKLQATHSQPLETVCEVENTNSERQLSSGSSADSVLKIPTIHQRGKSQSDPEFESHLERDVAGDPASIGRRAHSCNHLSSARDSRFFFFPGLMSHERPHDGHVWSEDDSFLYHTGWCMRVSHENQFFTPRLLHILLLRLSFGFATATSPSSGRGCGPTRQCTVWKNGIRWLDRDGIETVVEMVEQNRAVAILMRGKAGSELDCVGLRSRLVHLIMQVKEKFCPNLRIDQYLIDPKDIKSQPYPFATHTLNTFTLYELSMVATSVVDTKEWVIDTKGETFCHMGNLLYFEPYANLGRELLQRLCSDESEMVTDNKLYEFLHDYSQANFTFAHELSVVLKVRNKSRRYSKPQCLSCSSASINTVSVHQSSSLGNGLDSCSLFSTTPSVMSGYGQLLPPQRGLHQAQQMWAGSCEGGGRRGSNECMEVLDKWWHTSSSLTLADFRQLIHCYSLFQHTDLLEFCCCSETDSDLEPH